MCYTYHVNPQKMRLITVAELIAELRLMVSENAVTDAKAQLSISQAIDEQENRAAYTVTTYQDVTYEACEFDLPCCGAEVISVELKAGCDTCYTPVAFDVTHGKLRLSQFYSGTIRVTVVAYNHVTPELRTVRVATEGECEWQIIIEGQPHIPSYGIVQVCGEPWVYRCKTGTTFTQTGLSQEEYSWSVSSEDGILSTDSLSVDMAGMGDHAPSGNHTILYAKRIDGCGRLPDSDLLARLPGTAVVFPIVFMDGTQKLHLLSIAAANLYRSLIGSCGNADDIARYTGMQKHFREEAQRLGGKATRPVKTQRIVPHGFKTKLPHRNWWTSNRTWSVRGVDCCG